jgi:hypothetical protein
MEHADGGRIGPWTVYEQIGRAETPRSYRAALELGCAYRPDGDV